MEVRQIVKRLLERKIALALVLIAATGLAYMMGSRSETTTTGAATTQILIDAPQSALANLKQNTLPLTTRAGMFAQFMASTAVRESIGRAAGVPASQIVAKGPFDDPDAAPTGVTAATDAGAAPAYVLTFVAQEELPIVTVYAAAPDAEVGLASSRAPSRRASSSTSTTSRPRARSPTTIASPSAASARRRAAR